MADGEHTKKKLRRLMGNCPACGGPFGGHEYALFASGVCGRPSATMLADALEKDDWPRVVKCHDWEGSENNAEVFAVRCANGGMVVLVVFDPFDLFLNAETIELKVLSHSEGHDLDQLIDRAKWKSFNY
ncbi:MAG: hypothetical protein HY292_14805 [Planctomycetes bacterium]|nr:hypothetical protein [Planctomycetota bacterium]